MRNVLDCGKMDVLNLFIWELNKVSVFILDKNYNYLKINNGHKKFMKKLLGIHIEVGMNMLEIIEEYYTKDISDNLTLRIKDKMKNALKGNKIVTNEEVLIESDKVRFYEIEIIPVRDSSNNILGVGVCCLDTTENVNAMIEVLKVKLDLSYKKQVKNSDPLVEKDNNKNIFKILVAEDSNINQIVMSKLIELNGWIPKTVNNGQECLIALKKDRYDLIFMDISMPVMNGLEASNIIKKNPKWSRIPIIALTAYDSLDQNKEFEFLGIDDYLSKPIDPDKLKYIIDKHVNNNKIKLKEKERCTTFERLEKNLDGNKELVIELAYKIIQMFSKEQMDKIIRLSSQGDIESLTNLLHKLKGAASNFYLYEVNKKLNAIKEGAISGDINYIYKLVEEIRISVRNFKVNLECYSEK